MAVFLLCSGYRKFIDVILTYYIISIDGSKFLTCRLHDRLVLLVLFINISKNYSRLLLVSKAGAKVKGLF